MKESIKAILKRAGIYHPLQSFYRQVIFRLNRSALRSRYAKLKGPGLLCNVCGHSYSQFADSVPSAENVGAINKYQVIAGYGKNIICPYCLSSARDRLVIAVLEEMKPEGKHILHLSPEKPVYNFLSEHNQVVTADLTPGFYRTIDPSVITADATRLPFPDMTFDMVLANHIMEHIPDDISAIKEICRVMCNGATAILQVPYSETILYTMETPGLQDPTLQSELYGQKDHVRIYTLTDYIERLKSAGLQVNILSYSSLQRFYKYGIQQNESFLEIKKPATF